MDTALIALDWGSTSFRAYRLGSDGAILERMASEKGITTVGDEGFEAVLRGAIGGWLSPDIPVIAGGMITSRQGWVETPYASCPAGLDELRRGLVEETLSDGVKIRFVPGLSTRKTFPDVIRGEEAQIVGAAGIHGDGLYILPGTHSKWAEVRDGRVTGFATFITGELYSALRRHTLIGRMMTGEESAPEAFTKGLRAGQEDLLLHSLFSARTLGLFGEIPPEALPDYLSGLLIGAEIREGRRLYEAASSEAIVLIGGRALCERYARGLDGKAAFGPDDAAAQGLWRIANRR